MNKDFINIDLFNAEENPINFISKINLKTGEFSQEEINDLYYSAKMNCSLASQVVENDVFEAIAIIIESINSLPYVAPLFFYKLSNYLQKAQLYSQAHQAIEFLMNSNDIDDISMYNMYKSIDIEKYSLILYSEKNYREYIRYYFRWYHNRILAYTFQGRKDALVEMINKEDKLSLWAPTRINNCFKTLDIKYLVPKYNYEIHNYTNEVKESLMLSCKVIQKLGQKSSLNSGLSVGGYVNSLIKKNSRIFDTYMLLNNSYDDVYYHSNIERIFV